MMKQAHPGSELWQFFSKPSRLALTIAAVLAGTVFSPAVFAQDEADDDELLEEVIVTASKRDQRLVDVPMAVTALSGRDLVERNLLQIEDFAAQTPGLVVQQATNRATRVILRGLNSGGAGATVATLIDEASLSYSSSTSNGAIDIANLDTYDLNRIEVLRGPQGTLYGAAAEGGLIKYVTNAPLLDQFEGDAEFGLESVAHGDTGYTGRGMLNMPFADGKAALRITGFYKDVAGYIDNPLVGEKDLNGGERYGGRVQLLLQPNEDFSIRLMALMQDQNFDDPGLVELVGAALTPGTRSPQELKVANGGNPTWNSFYPGVSDNETRLYSAVLDWSTDRVDIISATSYGEINSTFRSDISFLEVAPGFTYTEAFSPFFSDELVSLYGDQSNDLSKFNQEFRFSSPEAIALGGIGFDWQLGAFYSDEDITFNQFYDAVDTDTGEVLLTTIFGPPLPLGGSELPASYKETSGFGEVVLHFTEQFDVAVGGRYSKNKQVSQVTSYAGLINAPFDIVNPVVKTSEDKFTWSVAPSYHLTDDKLVYGRIATGYRPGGPSLLIPGAPPDFPLSYSSDSTVNYEIGSKGTAAGGRFSYDFAAFYIDWTDIQILSQYTSTTSGQTFNITGNAGEARSKGLEWNFSWTLAEGLVLSDNGAYVSAELTESAPGLGGVKGDQLPLVPDWTNTLNLDYSTDISGVPVKMGVSWIYTGERYTGFRAATDPNDERFPGSHIALPSYSAFNAQISAHFDRFRVSLFGMNLTDEQAISGGYSTGGGYNMTGQGQIIQPRTIGVSVGASF